MKRMAYYAAVALLLSCTPDKSPENEDNLSGESTMCSVALTEITGGAFDKLVFKDMDHHILFKEREDGLPDHCVVQCELDTLSIIYDDNGLPNVISDGETYLFVGGYSGKTARICAVDPDNVSDVDEIELDADVDEYLKKLLSPTKASTQANNLANLTAKSVYERAFNWYETWYKTKKGSAKLSKGSVAAYLAEASLYLVSDDEKWQETVNDGFAFGGATIAIVQSLAGATPYFALAWSIKEICYDRIYLPLKEGGYHLPASDPRSAYGVEIHYIYQQIGSLVFGTYYRKCPWYGEGFDNEIITGGSNYNVQADDFIISGHPDWVEAQPVSSGRRNYLSVYCHPNDSHSSRSCTLKLTWPNPKGGTLEASFGIGQNPRPHASPESVTLSTTGAVRINVIDAVDGFEVYHSPLWCKFTALGKDYFEVMQNADAQNPEPGQIILSIPSGKDTWVPLYISVSPEQSPEQSEEEPTPGLAIDMGLSVKWASCNVGASSPEQYGGYYAWGETEEKSEYDVDSYWHFESIESDSEFRGFTKYCTDARYGYKSFTDGKTILDASDDVASVKWGGSWRMPTYAEIDELIDNCTWKWTTYKGTKGKLVTSKKNGNSIFLPAAGYRDVTNLYFAGSCGHYWSSSLVSGSPHMAWLMNFSSLSDYVYRSEYFRFSGFSVRPVSD